MPTHTAMGRSARTAAVLGLLLALVGSPAAAVEAQGVRVDVAAPSLLDEDAVLHPAVPAGGSATYAIQLRNQREQAVEVLVYGADVGPGGEVGAGTDNRGVGAWISADVPRVEVPPQTSVGVEVSIHRPGDDEDGGTGAIVAQLSDASRRELGLDRVQRAALRVDVAADGSGDGVHVEVVGTDAGGALVPGVLTVDVRFASPTTQEDLLFDGSVVVARPLVEDPTHPAAVDVLSAGEELTASVEVDLPWHGVIGRVHAEAAVVGLTTRSAPVRVVALPAWLGLLLLTVVVAAVLSWRRSAAPGEPDDTHVADRDDEASEHDQASEHPRRVEEQRPQ